MLTLQATSTADLRDFLDLLEELGYYTLGEDARQTARTFTAIEDEDGGHWIFIRRPDVAKAVLEQGHRMIGVIVVEQAKG